MGGPLHGGCRPRLRATSPNRTASNLILSAQSSPTFYSVYLQQRISDTPLPLGDLKFGWGSEVEETEEWCRLALPAWVKGPPTGAAVARTQRESLPSPPPAPAHSNHMSKRILPHLLHIVKSNLGHIGLTESCCAATLKVVQSVGSAYG
jgi:hypothetical protein